MKTAITIDCEPDPSLVVQCLRRVADELERTPEVFAGKAAHPFVTHDHRAEATVRVVPQTDAVERLRQLYGAPKE